MSNSVQDQINSVVGDFVGRITRLANELALNALKNALGDGAIATTPAPKRKQSTPAAAISRNRGNGQGGAKRTPEQLAELRTTLLSHIKANPGQRIEEINQALGTTTGQLQRPMRSLIDDGEVRSEGRLRSTKYFPFGAAKAKAKEPASSTKKASKAKPVTKKEPKAKAPKIAKAPKSKKAATSETATSETGSESTGSDTGSKTAGSPPGIEKDVLVAALEKHDGKISAAGRELGKSPDAVRRAIKRHGLIAKG